MFTMGAFHNFDHEGSALSGTGGTHDSLYSNARQIACIREQEAQYIRDEMSVRHRQRQYTKEWAYQSLNNYIRPTKRPALPERN